MNKLRLIILALAITSPIEKVGYILLFVFLSIEIYNWIKQKNNFNYINIKKGIFHPISMLFFAMLILIKLRNPIGPWDRDLSLILFPLIFSINPLKKTDKIYFFKSYIYSLAIMLLLLLIHEFIQEVYFENYVNLWKLSEYYNHNKILYFIHSVSERIDFHHIYFSLYLLVGFVIGFYLLDEGFVYKKNEKIALKLILLFFLIFSFLSLSRMTIICFILFGIAFLIKYILKNKKKIKSTLILTLLFVGVLMLCFNIKGKLYNRFKNIPQDPRVELFITSIKLSKESPLIGHGYKKASNLLQLKQKGNIPIYNNSHNQYLDFLLSGGIIMIIVFAGINSCLFRNFKRQKVYIALILQIIFLIQIMSESLLYRYRGIILYAVFMAIFYKNNYEIRKQKNLKVNL
ncbi:MAG: O-antigen ligase family protein [Flavobacteriales bacterium]